VTILHSPTTDDGDDPPVVLDAELVPLDEVLPRPLRYPPAIPESLVLTTCRCGNGTDRGPGLTPGRQRPRTARRNRPAPTGRCPTRSRRRPGRRTLGPATARELIPG
jgi:hypothetical protein